MIAIVAVPVFCDCQYPYAVTLNLGVMTGTLLYLRASSDRSLALVFAIAFV